MANASSNPQCPFCQLAANPEQTFNVHETEHFKAWLDINPRARGHTMVVPKEHWTSMEEIGEHASELFEIIRIVMEKARNGIGADGVSVVLNDGEAAGQRLEHFYAQVFPRFSGEENEGAPAGAVFQPLEGLDESDLEELSKKMLDANYSSSGGKTIDGPGTTLTRSNRNSGTTTNQKAQKASNESRIVDRSELEQQPDENTTDEDDEADEDDESEDGKEKKKKRSSWDGDQYSWGSDGAEFK